MLSISNATEEGRSYRSMNLIVVTIGDWLYEKDPALLELIDVMLWSRKKRLTKALHLSVQLRMVLGYEIQSAFSRNA